MFRLTPSRLLSFLLLALTGPGAAFASLPELTPANQRYRLEHWENENGLPQNYVISVNQSKDGYIWVALLGSIVRFNGQQFLPYATKDGADSFRNIFVRKDGTVLAGTVINGVQLLGPQGPIPWELNGKLASKDIRSFAESEDGSLWVGTANQLVRWNQDKLEVAFPTKEAPKARGAYALLPESDGSVLAGTSRGLLRVKEGKVSQVSLSEALNKASITALVKTPDGALWVGTAGFGIARVLPDGTMNILDTEAGLPSNHVRSFLLDRSGVLWVGTMQGLVKWNGKAFEFPDVPDMAIDYDVMSLFQDVEGGIWVSGARGLVRLDPGRFALLGKTIGLGRRSLRCVKEFSDGSIWVGTSNGGIARIQNGVSTVFRLKEGIERTVDTILTVEEMAPGKAVVGTYEGLFFVENDKAVFPPQPLRYSREIRVIHKDRAGLLWIGTTRNGLICYDGQKVTALGNETEGIPANDIRAIVDHHKDGIWVGSAEGLTHRQGAQEKRWGIKEGLPSKIIQCLYTDAGGALWIGTDKGLACLSGDKIKSWTVKDGLLSDDVRDIVEDHFGNLWMTSPVGLFRMRKNDLELSAQGDKRLLGHMRFGSAWGVINCTSPSPTTSTACTLKDGRLLFTTVAGLLVVEPSFVEPNLRKPPVVIDSVRYRETNVPVRDGGITIGPEQGSLEIDFTALSYEDPARVLFRYRLEGVDPQWIQTDRRATISYHNLRYGTYRFHVIACNNDGVWNEEGCTLAITIRPHFYEQLWFRALVVLVGLLGIFLSFRLRYRQIRRRQEQLTRAVEERTRSLKEEIATRTQVERELRSSEERFSKVFGSSPIPLALVSLKEEIFVDANSSFCALMDLPLETILGQKDVGLPVWSSPEIRDNLYQEIRAHRRVLNRECELLIHGRKRRLLVSAEHLGLRSGDLMLLIMLDITDRLELEQQVRRLQKIEATGQLAAGIAHDFNNLLTVIIGQLSLLMETDQQRSSDDVESISQARKAAERAATLTRQLLTFSRKQRIEQRPFQVNDLIERLMQILKPVMGESIELKNELAPNLPLLSGDETLIEQVLINIAMNGRDAMPQGGTFKLETALVTLKPQDIHADSEAKPGTFISIKACDTGVGMPREVLERIFEPFFTTKEPGRGTGLGMPMAYGAIKQHGGWIEVKSEPNCGTEVLIMLPSTDTPAESVRKPKAPKNNTLAGGCILYVEDEPSVRKMVKRSLESKGYRVIIATDGPSALEAWKNNADHIDMVFSDIVMPGGMSGVDLARLLRQERPNLRLLLATGYSSDAFKLKHEADIPILPKPFSIEELLNAIAAVMNS